jgi:hypothetical protein
VTAGTGGRGLAPALSYRLVAESGRRGKSGAAAAGGHTESEREENRRASQSPHSRTASGGQHIDVRGHLAAGGLLR